MEYLKKQNLVFVLLKYELLINYNFTMLVELVDTFDLGSIALKRKRSSRLYCILINFFGKYFNRLEY